MKSPAEQERDSLRAVYLEKVRTAEKPLIAELASVGVTCTSVYTIGKSRSNYSAAIPILLRHAALEYPSVIKEGIYAALAHRSARSSAWDAVLNAYRREPNLSDKAPEGQIGAPSGPKDQMAAALSTMATPEDANTVVELISDAQNGPSRIFFVKNLMRWKAVKPLLHALRSDPDLTVEIERRLKGVRPLK